MKQTNICLLLLLDLTLDLVACETLLTETKRNFIYEMTADMRHETEMLMYMY